jgi:hypothetical protein
MNLSKLFDEYMNATVVVVCDNFEEKVELMEWCNTLREGDWAEKYFYNYKGDLYIKFDVTLGYLDSSHSNLSSGSEYPEISFKELKNYSYSSQINDNYELI